MLKIYSFIYYHYYYYSNRKLKPNFLLEKLSLAMPK